MGIVNWFRHPNKGNRKDGPFEDTVPEEFGLDEGEAEGEATPPPRQARVQLNILVTPELAMTLRLLSRSYKIPIYAAGEHSMSFGMVHLAEASADPTLFKKMSDHLLKNHVLGTEIRDSLDILELGRPAKKVKQNYFYVNVDSRLLKFLKALEKVTKQVMQEVDRIQSSGDGSTLPWVRETLERMLRGILANLAHFPDPEKTTTPVVPPDPAAGIVQKETSQFSAGVATDKNQPKPNIISNRVGFGVVEMDGNFCALPRKNEDFSEDASEGPSRYAS
jgi:hypothetical protein